ncbi:DNA primase [Lentibacillus salinarum]|uniref:DNA primase n=1 Tax=Lentibacillus salinarum TaxID=446820 RepID=A0ABW3ZX77_9BACI
MSAQIPEEVVEEVRRSNDIVDVIGDYIQLKKQGRNYFGLCPFHGEKTPSFSVTQDKQIFHCFGCGKGGNVVTFIMEIEGYTFYEALRLLSERSGVALPVNARQPTSSMSQENQNILSASEWMTKLYHHLLRYTKDGKEGYQYFKERGIADETIDAFQLGFAPNIKDFTAEFLTKKGFHQQLLVKAGLLSVNEDNTADDRFRGRVIFPIRNHLGKTVAFGGRTVANQEPKYLNSPESELFQKGKLLYNFDLAKKHIRKQSEAVLFEGYMDVISAYQAGVKNAVATLGTSLTEAQAQLLRRYVDTVIICYDADAAGTEAAYKASVTLQKAGCHVKIANLQENMDPDDYISEYGSETFRREVIQSSLTFTSFYMRYLKKDFNLSLEADRIQYIENVLEYIATIDSPVEREYYLNEISQAYHVSMESLQQEIQVHREKMGPTKDKIKKNRYTNREATDKRTKKLLPAFHNAERQLMAYMLQDASITDKVQEEIGASFNIDDHKIIATHLYAYYEEQQNPDVSSFVEMLTDNRLKELVTEIAMIPVHATITHDEINDYIRMIRAENSNQQSIQSLKAEQRLAEQQNDPIKAAGIAMQIIELQKQWKSIK